MAIDTSGMTDHLRLEWNRSRRILLSLALGMILSATTAVPTFASSGAGATCAYTTTVFVGTYCSGATYTGIPK
jgi:hypothetical protein